MTFEIFKYFLPLTGYRSSTAHVICGECFPPGTYHSTVSRLLFTKVKQYYEGKFQALKNEQDALQAKPESKLSRKNKELLQLESDLKESNPSPTPTKKTLRGPTRNSSCRKTSNSASAKNLMPSTRNWPKPPKPSMRSPAPSFPSKKNSKKKKET